MSAAVWRIVRRRRPASPWEHLRRDSRVVGHPAADDSHGPGDGSVAGAGGGDRRPPRRCRAPGRRQLRVVRGCRPCGRRRDRRARRHGSCSMRQDLSRRSPRTSGPGRTWPPSSTSSSRARCCCCERCCPTCGRRGGAGSCTWAPTPCNACRQATPPTPPRSRPSWVWARELGPLGITVNTVAPGWVPVERHSGAPDSAFAEYRATIPVGRFGEPGDVAAAVAFLASGPRSPQASTLSIEIPIATAVNSTDRRRARTSSPWCATISSSARTDAANCSRKRRTSSAVPTAV